MKPTLGRIVLYRLGEADVDNINSLPTNNNPVKVGDLVPAIIVAVWGPEQTSAVNLKLFLDGVDTYWRTSACGTDDGAEQQPYCWAWPPRI